MLNRSQKAEAERLIQEVEELRPRLEKFNAKPLHYRAARIANQKIYGTVAIMASIVAVAGISSLVVNYYGYINLSLLGIIIATVITIGAFILAGIMCLLWMYAKGSTTEQDISTTDSLRCLSNLLVDYRRNLSLYDKLVTELESLIQKFESLRPVIERELRGEMYRTDQLHKIEYHVRIPYLTHPRSISTYDVTEERYGDLVLDILEARENKVKKDKEDAEAKAARLDKIRRFEAELASQGSDL